MAGFRRTVEWLLGREVGSGEREWHAVLTADFTEGGYDYRALIKDVVLSETYRSLP